ncbi:putative hydrolase YutF [Poriferisphaera corsica]|uniref:Putative hydrolase YutF n=1 Tax=Poriferisphaera corsica TaxID=2528020 RepID=A0A517YW15_9BACT|nr:HAD-IIA family hydrolase [Poriferisphaera corsica]QDU34399.1 putative hydrolase YutF [Poriferisphaera corsica]
MKIQDEVQGRLKEVKHVILDMDGTIYRGSELFDFTLPFLEAMGANGIGYTFLTNNCSRSVEQYLTKLDKLGVPASRENLLTSMHCAVFYLQKHMPNAKRVYVQGTKGLMDDLAAAGYVVVNAENDSGCEKPDVVVVGFDMGLVYERLCQACWWVKQGVPYIATHPDVFCPTDEPTWLVDCGAVTKCVEAATEIAPVAVLGKPHAYMIKPILEKHGLSGNEAIMIGDRLGTDVAMGIRAGTLSCLVLTGDSQVEDIEKMGIKPSIVAASLKELGEAILDAKKKEQSNA